MAKQKKIEADDDMRAEYDFSNGVRGKFASAFPEGSRVVVLDPDVAAVFKSQKSANAALRALAETVKQVNEQP